MPRKSTTRNHQGTILVREVRRNKKTVKVYEARKRFALIDENGDFVLGKNGKKVYREKTKTCYSKSEAQIALDNLPALINAEKEKLAKPDDRTLFELVGYFRKNYVKPAIYSGSQKIGGYRQSLKTVNRYLDEIEEFFGDVSIKKITYEDLRSFAEHLASTPTKHGKLPAASTSHKKLTILGRLFNIALQLDWITRSPVKRGPSLIRRSAENRRHRVISFEEERRLLAVCTGPRSHLRPYVLAAMDTAMRRSEIFALRWWQVDFQARVILLSGIAAVETKTGIEGVLPLTRRLADELKTIYESRSDVNPDDLVLGRTEFKRSWKTVCELAGIEDLQFRDLRAGAITRMLMAGITGDVVRKISRHTSDRVFLANYTRINEANARSVAERLDELHEDVNHENNPNRP